MRDILLDFAIPAMLILGCLVLLGMGIDSEVKAILAMAAGWACPERSRRAFHAGEVRHRTRRRS